MLVVLCWREKLVRAGKQKNKLTVGLDVAVTDGHVQSGGDHCVHDITTAVQFVERLSQASTNSVDSTAHVFAGTSEVVYPSEEHVRTVFVVLHTSLHTDRCFGSTVC